LGELVDYGHTARLVNPTTLAGNYHGIQEIWAALRAHATTGHETPLLICTQDCRRRQNYPRSNTYCWSPPGHRNAFSRSRRMASGRVGKSD
jgi:hypothetical protein